MPGSPKLSVRPKAVAAATVNVFARMNDAIVARSKPALYITGTHVWKTHDWLKNSFSDRWNGAPAYRPAPWEKHEKSAVSRMFVIDPTTNPLAAVTTHASFDDAVNGAAEIADAINRKAGNFKAFGVVLKDDENHYRAAAVTHEPGARNTKNVWGDLDIMQNQGVFATTQVAGLAFTAINGSAASVVALTNGNIEKPFVMLLTTNG